MVYKKRIYKRRRSYKKRKYNGGSGNYMVHEHTRAFGITTDALGTDGASAPLLFTDFRNTADCAGMYRTFRILAYGIDMGAC